MLQEFIDFIKKEKLINKKDSILLAISGGSDSVVMCDLFSKAGLKFAIAHCNFKLRGKESDGDEVFVKQLAGKLKTTIYTTTFETEKHAKKEGISIQMAARELRYNWFEKIRSENNFSYIALAHHQDDVIETFFINLLRGTGISGLHGILPKNASLIRPLLFSSKEQILQYCKENKLKFREDSSNSSVKYTRNKIRHQIIPLLIEINPSFKSTLINNIEHLKFVEKIYTDHLAKKAQSIISHNDNKLALSINEIEKLNYQSDYLYELLKPYNFNYTTVNDIVNSLNNISGKIFYSSTHRLLKDRKYLLVEELQKYDDDRILLDENTKYINAGKYIIKLEKTKIANITENQKKPSYAILDYDLLSFPLTVRKWEKGDWFYPLGMNKKKKLSDFFIDNKVPVFEKENILVLCSGNDIVWVVGHRINNLYKIGQKTKNMYIAQVL